MEKIKITFLGTGTSTGIPMIGCPCNVCQSNNEKNKRLRTSIYVEYGELLKFIVDTGPDLRTQLLRENITKCDFAIITHDHSDHLHGIDDLRPFTFLPSRRTLPVFCHPLHSKVVENKFNYIFKRDEVFNKSNPYLGGGLPLLNLHDINEIEQLFPKINIENVVLPHGSGHTTGLIIDKRFAYIIDCHEIPEDTVRKLQSYNLECLVIDCLQRQSHPSHLSLNKSFEYIQRISPKSCYLIHMNHDLEHEELEKLAQKTFKFHVAPAFDRQQLNI